MSEFFRGWRRKIGCVTLMLSCVFMIGWVRSLASNDYISFQSFINYEVKNGRLAGLATTKHFFYLMAFEVEEPGPGVLNQFVSTPGSQTSFTYDLRNAEVDAAVDKVMTASDSATAPHYTLQYDEAVNLRTVDDQPTIVQMLGTTDTSESGGSPTLAAYTLCMLYRTVKVWTIPFWSIVIPLTVVSAFLLLAKPSESTGKNSVTQAADGL